MIVFSWKFFVLADATHSIFECYRLTDGVIPILLQFILIMYVNMQTTAGTVLADFHLKFEKHFTEVINIYTLWCQFFMQNLIMVID